jgi:hypothetical protein
MASSPTIDKLLIVIPFYCAARIGVLPAGG